MNHIVTGAMCSLCVVVALITPPTLVQRAAKEFVIAPDVRYRVERFWRMAPEEDIIRQAEKTLADAKLEFFISRAVYVDRWWITEKVHNLQRNIADWYADRSLLSKLKELYRDDQRNWNLYDCSIIRNDKPIDVPEAVKKSIWQYQMERDQQMRDLFQIYSDSPFALERVFGSRKFEREAVSQWIQNRVSQNMWTDICTYAAVVANDTFGTETEAIYIYPYVLLIRDGVLLGVLGGRGEFDFIPDKWKQFCRDNQISLGR